MKSQTYPLALPKELLSELRETAEKTGLSVADTMRQSMRLGLPQLRVRMGGAESLKPFSKDEARRAFGPDPEWDPLEAAMAKILIQPIEE